VRSRLVLLTGVSIAVSAILAAAVLLPRRGAAAPSTGAGASVVRVTERDFQIAVATSRVAAGSVVVRVTNKGPDQHELIVVRDNGRLPLRADGMTVDEESLAKQIVGALEPGPPGDVRELRLTLAPGRYLLLCNMYGHYMAGMHAGLLVR
jgi:uncharacterized cupredoxin-like copper-binding protein